MNLDKETLDYWVNVLQKKSDKIAGLKIQNINLKKENTQLENENKQLASNITTLNHEYERLKKEYEGVLKNKKCNYNHHTAEGHIFCKNIDKDFKCKGAMKK